MSQRSHGPAGLWPGKGSAIIRSTAIVRKKLQARCLALRSTCQGVDGKQSSPPDRRSAKFGERRYAIDENSMFDWAAAWRRSRFERARPAPISFIVLRDVSCDMAR